MLYASFVQYPPDLNLLLKNFFSFSYFNCSNFSPDFIQIFNSTSKPNGVIDVADASFHISWYSSEHSKKCSM